MIDILIATVSGAILIGGSIGGTLGLIVGFLIVLTGVTAERYRYIVRSRKKAMD
jgi:hypothetical protein